MDSLQGSASWQGGWYIEINSVMLTCACSPAVQPVLNDFISHGSCNIIYSVTLKYWSNNQMITNNIKDKIAHTVQKTCSPKYENTEYSIGLVNPPERITVSQEGGQVCNRCYEY